MLLVLSIISIIIYYIYQQKCKWKWKHIDAFNGPPVYPIIGNLSEIMKTTQKIIEDINELSLVYKSPVRVWLIHIPFLLVYDAENFKIILNKVQKKGAIFRFIEKVFGDGLISIDNLQKWRDHRRLIKPVFNLKEKGSCYLQMFNCENKLLDTLRTACDKGGTVNLWKLVYNHQCREAFKTLLDFDPGEDTDMIIEKFSRLIKKGVLCAVNRGMQPWLYIDTINNVYCNLTRKNRIFQELQQFAEQILNREGMKNELENKKCTEKLFINLLLESEENNLYKKKELNDEIITFLDTAIVTSSTLLSYTLTLLAIHSGAQQKVYDEIQHIFTDEEQLLDIEKYDQLIYLEQCLKETLRLFPPAPQVIRTTDKTIELKDGRIIPPGVTLIMSMYYLHRDPDVYAEPDKWIPDRFSEEEAKKRPPYSFCPFGGGPRYCIGYKFAMLSAKSALVRIIKNFKLTTHLTLNELQKNVDYMSVIIRSKIGFPVIISSRKTNK